MYRKLTLLLGGHFTGDTGHVAVEPSPAALALAAVGGASLPTLATVLAWRGVAPPHQVLEVAKAGNCILMVNPFHGVIRKL